MSVAEAPPPVTPPPASVDDGEVGDWMARKFGRSWRTRFVAGGAFACLVVQGAAMIPGGPLPAWSGALAGVFLSAMVGIGMWHAADDKALGPKPK